MVAGIDRVVIRVQSEDLIKIQREKYLLFESCTDGRAKFVDTGLLAGFFGKVQLGPAESFQ